MQLSHNLPKKYFIKNLMDKQCPHLNKLLHQVSINCQEGTHFSLVSPPVEDQAFYHGASIFDWLLTMKVLRTAASFHSALVYGMSSHDQHSDPVNFDSHSRHSFSTLRTHKNKLKRFFFLFVMLREIFFTSFFSVDWKETGKFIKPLILS